ncbi:hypothetical protein [Bacillus sp. 37MA]|uniref:hypothetical protein n=1 Tax=Bacillus sp. 37MA TaxID=1132442 RepID=UPI000374E961|nr:hypothetical protein [Bacillus sp. 37MA]
MKKQWFAGSVFFSAVLILSGCINENSSSDTSQETASLAEAQLKKEAQILDYTTMSENGIEDGAKVVIDGIVASADDYADNGTIPARTKFVVKKEDDSIHYWVENLSDDLMRLDSHVKVYGTYKGIDEESLLPVVEGEVVEVVSEDITDENKAS